MPRKTHIPKKNRRTSIGSWEYIDRFGRIRTVKKNASFEDRKKIIRRKALLLETTKKPKKDTQTRINDITEILKGQGYRVRTQKQSGIITIIKPGQGKKKGTQTEIHPKQPKQIRQLHQKQVTTEEQLKSTLDQLIKFLDNHFKYKK